MKKVNKEQLRMQMLAGIITEGQYKAKLNENIESFEDYISGMFDMSIPEDTEGSFTGVWEKSEYANPESYDEADEFIRLEQYLESVGGKATLEGNPDIMLELLPNGDIKFSANLSLNEEEGDYDENSWNAIAMGNHEEALKKILGEKYNDSKINFFNGVNENTLTITSKIYGNPIRVFATEHDKNGKIVDWEFEDYSQIPFDDYLF